jgi:2-dehydro-3-deoxygluconokinase
MAKRFLAIGECMVEFVGTGDNRFRQGFSGDTLDAALAARRSLGPGWRVGLFTAIGDDDWSARLFAFLKAAELETNHVRRLPGRRPGISVTAPGDAAPSTEVWRENSAALDLADDHDVLEAAVVGANAILFSAATLAILAPDARGQLLASVERAKARGAVVAFDSVVDPAAWPETGTLRAVIRAAARASTLVFAAVANEAPLFGEAGTGAVAARYAGDGCREGVFFEPSGAAAVLWPAGRIAVPAGTFEARSAFRNAYLAERLKGAAPDVAAGVAVGMGDGAVRAV